MNSQEICSIMMQTHVFSLVLLKAVQKRGSGVKDTLQGVICVTIHCPDAGVFPILVLKEELLVSHIKISWLCETKDS